MGLVYSDSNFTKTLDCQLLAQYATLSFLLNSYCIFMILVLLETGGVETKWILADLIFHPIYFYKLRNDQARMH